MTPEDFVRSVQAETPAPAYLFLGPETFGRDRCRQALIGAILSPELQEAGVTRFDLDEVSLPEVLDDARSFSLFATERVIMVSSAEAVLPRGRAVSSGEGDGPMLIRDFVRNPTPGVVIVFDCVRYDFDGDDKAQVQRLQKFYADIAQVEFQRYTPAAVKRLAAKMAEDKKLEIGEPELQMLVELTGADASRVSNEIEKLAIFAGEGKRISADDIQNLSADTKSSTIFVLVTALGKKERHAALEALDTLVRDGAYLPLALSFLSTQFRLALVAKEARLASAGQVQSHFTKTGTPMWRSRAEQVAQTAGAFSGSKLRHALVQIYEADKALRDARPDDRTVMERLVLKLTAS